MGRKPIRNIGRKSRGNTGNASGDANGNGSEILSPGIESPGESNESGTVAAGGDQPVSLGVNGDGTQFVDPAAAETDNQPDSGGKRRGRPRGSSNKRTSTTQATADISSLLFSLHLGMAAFLKSDVLILTEEESQRLGAAITRVTDLYDIRILPEKYMAWINLAIVGTSVYGPRAAVVMTQTKKKPTTVIPFPTQPQPDPMNPAPQGA